MAVQPDTATTAQAALDDAIRNVPGPDLAAALSLVAHKLPVAASVEKVAIRLRDTDGEAVLHVAAVEGTPPSDRFPLIFAPQTIAQARSIFVLGDRHSYGRALGLRWLHGEWLMVDAEAIGTITVGSRTERRPDESELTLLQSAAVDLAERLKDIDRRSAALEALSRQVARDSIITADGAPDNVRKALRPRELVILSLYADGLSAQEIADVFVISAHTVRTHIKNAYRRLGIHSREEASQVIREQRVLDLV